jgi:hypothetical protein
LGHKGPDVMRKQVEEYLSILETVPKKVYLDFNCSEKSQYYQPQSPPADVTPESSEEY